MNDSKYILTGATGFLGSHVLRTLLENTDYNIVVLKRTFSDTKRISEFLNSERITFYDIDKTNLEDIDWENTEAIIHCAVEYGRKSKSSCDILEANLMFPIKLLEYAIKNNVKAFINTDSFFNKENRFYSNLLSYSLSKRCLNLWLEYFSKDIKVINLILEHIYGEFDGMEKFVESMIQNIAVEQKEFVDLTLGEQKRDFVYVDDVCRVYLASVEYAKNHEFSYKTFEVGTGKATYLKDFVKEIKKISSSSTKLNFGKIPYRKDEIMQSCANVNNLSELIDASKFITYKQGIKKIIDIYKEGI